MDSPAARMLVMKLGNALMSVQALLFLVFVIFYHFAAQQIVRTPMYERDDVFFRADTTRALKDIAGDRTQKHVHTTGHPNFVILNQPLGSTLRDKIKRSHPGMTKPEAVRRASIFMTSVAGAATVALFGALLLANGLPRMRAGLFAAVFGCSATQMFYASTPETYIFSALGLTAVAFLASRREVSEGWWQAASVYAWSMLTTNIALVGLWALARFWQLPIKDLAVKLAKVMAVTVALTVALSLVQAAIYPDSKIFFMPSSVARETGWLDWTRLQHPIANTRVLLQHLWLSNIIGPEPVRTIMFGKPMASIEAGTWAMVAPSLPLLGLWIMLLAGAATSLFRREFYQPMILAALAVLAFNFAFFFIFGNDRMLYAALWTSTSVFVVATGVELLLKRRPGLVPVMTVLLPVLVAGMAWHNWHFLGKLAALVAD
ncbi:MAG: hypothetical protein JWO89_2389 [Verrucomicrobiaceae bacterium]|nr:hypothetical protein [Verrucomicrobiaceae bacterium]